MTEEEYVKSPMAMRLEQRMEEVGFETKGKLSTASGVSRAILTNIMRRPEKEIWASVAVRLAKHLKCRVEWLLEGTGPVSDDLQENFDMVYGGCPTVNLSQLAVETPEALVAEAHKAEKNEVLHCPIMPSKSTVAVKAEMKLGKFDAEDYIFVDLEEHKPRSGQIVLARKRGATTAPDFYSYNTALDKVFLRSLNEDLPQELRIIEMTKDIEVVGCVIAAAKIF